MICEKELTISVDGSCSGLTLTAPWIHIDNSATPGSYTYTYSFLGYAGTYSFAGPNSGAAVFQKTDRLEYTRLVAGGNVRITHRITGTVDLTATPLPGAQSFTIRAYSNGTVDDVSQLCPNEGVTPINLVATATSAVVLNNVLYVYFITNARARHINFQAVITVDCF